MKQIKFLILPALLALATLLSNCTTRSNVKYSYLNPAPTASISGDQVMLHLGYDRFNSAWWTKVETRPKGDTIYIYATGSLRERSREISIPIPDNISESTVNVVWVEPDGNHVEVPIIR